MNRGFLDLKMEEIDVKKHFIIVLCLIQSLFIFAQNADSPVLKAEVSIRFYDRRIYYPGSGSSEPIFIQISITNNNSETFRFKLADDRSGNGKAEHARKFHVAPAEKALAYYKKGDHHT